MAIPNRNINYPTAIKYGAGRIKELAEFCKANGIRILFQGAYAIVLFAYLVWGVQILWGN